MSDMSARDELVQQVAEALNVDHAPDGTITPLTRADRFFWEASLADAETAVQVVLAAGWRPPAADSEPDEGESAGASTSEILRYEISIDDSDYVVPTGHVVLVHAHRQCLENRLEVWIQVADGETRTQTVRVFGTGQLIPAGWRPLGSCVAGPFVWHLCGVE